MKPTQTILGVNTGFDSLEYNNYTECSIQSKISYLDYDAIIIDTDQLSLFYKECPTGPYQNRRMLSTHASHQIVEDFRLIKEQIIAMLKQGKNIFVLLGTNEPCFVYTGETRYSGTGKNARRTNVVTSLDMYSFLPINISVTHVVGEKVEVCCQQPYLSFFNKTRDLYYYKAYFSLIGASELLKISGSEKILASVYEYESGKIVFLPYPRYEDDYVEEKEWKKYGKQYLDALFELNKKLSTKVDEYVYPEWVDEFSILNEAAEKKKLKEDIKKLEKLKAKIEKQKEVLKGIKKYKMLVTASGTELEEIVKEVLQELGFNLSVAEQGRSDVIAKYGEQGIVAEIKGVTKSAAERHAAQLEKWTSQYIEENDEIPKALLIVNGFSELHVNERKEEVFPHQMLAYCQARGHALITTTQLLCLYIETIKNKDCKEDRIQELLSCVGKYQRYEDISEYLIFNEDGE